MVLNVVYPDWESLRDVTVIIINIIFTIHFFFLTLYKNYNYYNN